MILLVRAAEGLIVQTERADEEDETDGTDENENNGTDENDGALEVAAKEATPVDAEVGREGE